MQSALVPVYIAALPDSKHVCMKLTFHQIEEATSVISYYERFRSVYPDFKGIQKKFTEALIYIEWLRKAKTTPPRALCDDVVRVYTDEYAPFCQAQFKAGKTVTLTGWEYYDTYVRKAIYQEGVITPENLPEALNSLDPDEVAAIRGKYNAQAKRMSQKPVEVSVPSASAPPVRSISEASALKNWPPVGSFRPPSPDHQAVPTRTQTTPRDLLSDTAIRAPINQRALPDKKVVEISSSSPPRFPRDDAVQQSYKTEGSSSPPSMIKVAQSHKALHAQSSGAQRNLRNEIPSSSPPAAKDKHQVIDLTDAPNSSSSRSAILNKGVFELQQKPRIETFSTLPTPVGKAPRPSQNTEIPSSSRLDFTDKHAVRHKSRDEVPSSSPPPQTEFAEIPVSSYAAVVNKRHGGSRNDVPSSLLPPLGKAPQFLKASKISTVSRSDITTKPALQQWSGDEVSSSSPPPLKNTSRPLSMPEIPSSSPPKIRNDPKGRTLPWSKVCDCTSSSKVPQENDTMRHDVKVVMSGQILSY